MPALNASLGRTVLMTASPGMQIRMLSLALTVDDLGGGQSVRVNFYSHGADDSWELIAGPFTLPADGILVLPWAGNGWFETADGADLVIEVFNTGTVGGCFTYAYAP